MKITTNDIYLILLNPIITEDVEAYIHLSQYIKNCG